MKYLLVTILLASAVAFTWCEAKSQDNFVPPDGYVPNADVAIKIAVAVWEPIYGAEHIAKEKPFRAVLKDGVWTVQGSLPKGMKGGVALAEISKADGRIIRVIHGK
jgi:hypothetical protein